MSLVQSGSTSLHQYLITLQSRGALAEHVISFLGLVTVVKLKQQFPPVLKNSASYEIVKFIALV